MIFITNITNLEKKIFLKTIIYFFIYLYIYPIELQESD